MRLQHDFAHPPRPFCLDSCLVMPSCGALKWVVYGGVSLDMLTAVAAGPCPSGKQGATGCGHWSSWWPALTHLFVGIRGWIAALQCTTQGLSYDSGNQQSWGGVEGPMILACVHAPLLGEVYFSDQGSTAGSVALFSSLLLSPSQKRLRTCRGKAYPFLRSVIQMCPASPQFRSR